MTPHLANIINGVVLGACSVWAYVASGGALFTPFIPAAFGIALLACTPGLKAENKVVALVAALLTLVVIVSLVVPLQGAIGRGDGAASVRVGLMMAASCFAMAVFVKSFIDVRRQRKTEQTGTES